MPYSSRLKYLGDWYAQLWAESLGKELDREGNKINNGPTPIKALGATDQHSQIQLYNEGKNDKVITFIRVKEFENSVEIPNIFDITFVDFVRIFTNGDAIIEMKRIIPILAYAIFS